jgi:hypothetical protein
MMIIDSLDVLLGGSKYLEYIPESELNIYWVNMKLNNKIESNKEFHWMKALNKSPTKYRTINNGQQAIINKQKINHKCHLKRLKCDCSTLA